MKLIKQTRRSKRGAALVEYGLIVAGVALVAAAAVSIFGSKTSGMISATTSVLPGANSEDNGLISVGHAVKVKNDAGVISVDNTNPDDNNLGANLGLGSETLINDPGSQP